MCEIPTLPCLETRYLEIAASLCKEPPQSNDRNELSSEIHKNRSYYLKQPREISSKQHSHYLDPYLIVFAFLGSIILTIVSYLV